MNRNNESSSEKELDRALIEAIGKITEAVRAIAQLKQVAETEERKEPKWYVLKHDGVHHLVTNRSTHAYCGWPVREDAEMIHPPPHDRRDQFQAIADEFCPGCAEAARTIDRMIKERIKTEREG